MTTSVTPSGTEKKFRNSRFEVKELFMGRLVNVYSGTAVTRAAVRALIGDGAPQGSVFIGSGAVATTKPNMYVKTANGGADTDWERVVTAATD